MTTKAPSDAGSISQLDEQREALAKLRQPDAIFQRDVFQSLVRFINLAGVPEDAIEGFSSSYRGVPVMCNVLSDWLQATGMAPEQVEQSIRSNFRQMVVKHFDPNKTDQIFAAMSSAPEWLKEMIGQEYWRNMIYQLSEMHKNCLMLNLAIQLTSDAGFHTEMASLSTAAGNFMVFNSVILEHMKRISSSKDEATLRIQIEEFASFCSNGQHTYTYIQAVLNRLALSREGHSYRRLIQEVEAVALRQSNLSLKLSLLFTEAMLYPDAAAGITSIIESGTTNSADITKIHRQYSQANPPPVRLLRHPRFLEVVVRDLFNHRREIAAGVTERYNFILAFASSVDDTRVFHPGKTDVIEGALSMHGFQETLNALSLVVPICRKNLTGTEMLPHIEAIVAQLHHPIIRIGLVNWLVLSIEDQSFFLSNHHTATHSTYITLLKRLIPLQRFQGEAILKLLLLLLEETSKKEGSRSIELQKETLDLFVDLIINNYVEQTFEVVERWLRTVDTAYSRHFINKMLNSVLPPYSPFFFKTMIRMTQYATATNPILKSVDIRPALSELLAAFHENPFALNETETKNLEDVSLSLRS